MKEKLYTIPLNDAVNENDECPFCFIERKLEQDMINFVLGSSSSYMESDIREQTGSKQGESDSEIGRFGRKVRRCIHIAGICGRYDVVPRKHRSSSQQDGSGS